MNKGQFTRTELQLGAAALERIWNSKVALFGVGGVGGSCAEALVRGGVGALDMYDPDTVALSNLNRQAAALHSTLGQLKVDALRARLLDISPEAEIGAFPLFYSSETAETVELSRYDYVIDAVDTVSAKLELAFRASSAGVPIISSMGAGNKLDPTRFEVADVYSTEVCPLARVMRRELRKRGVSSLKVVYSREIPLEVEGRVPSSNSFVPPVVGLILAGEVLKSLAKREDVG